MALFWHSKQHEANMSEIKVITVAGIDALSELERRRAQFKTTGLYPILLGSADDYSNLLEGMKDDGNFYDVLRESDTIDAPLWFRKRAEVEHECYQAKMGEWPGTAPEPLGLITHLEVLGQKPKHEVNIALFEGTFTWEVFAHLRYGGWNDCPFAAEHCAVHRYWAERYGAEVVSVTDDIVQCVVSRPPLDRQASVDLAREQYIYCYDIVEQGVGTIAALGACLLNAKHWYFWWD
jgi:Domain of unknown function (DUF4253)